MQEQQKCPELQAYTLGKHSPRVKLQPVKFKGHDVICDVTTERPRPYIPASLRTYVLKSCHNLDHCGQAEAKTRAKKYYFWPSMGRDTSKYVKTCHPCQTTKPT